MVSTRMEAKLDSNEKRLTSWTQNQDGTVAQIAQQNPRLAKLEQMVERLATLLGEKVPENNNRETPHNDGMQVESVRGAHGGVQVESEGETHGGVNVGDKWRKLDIPVSRVTTRTAGSKNQKDISN